MTSNLVEYFDLRSITPGQVLLCDIGMSGVMYGHKERPCIVVSSKPVFEKGKVIPSKSTVDVIQCSSRIAEQYFDDGTVIVFDRFKWKEDWLNGIRPVYNIDKWSSYGFTKKTFCYLDSLTRVSYDDIFKLMGTIESGEMKKIYKELGGKRKIVFPNNYGTKDSVTSDKEVDKFWKKYRGDYNETREKYRKQFKILDSGEWVEIPKEKPIEPVTEELLLELRKSTLLSGSKAGKDYKGDKSKGRNRYARRTKSRVSGSVREFNEIDMNKLFKEGILIVSIKIIGETDEYLVEIKFGGITAYLNEEIEKNGGRLETKCIIRAITNCFNRDDVYIRCTCPDWKYRFGYYSLVGDYNSDPDAQARDLAGAKSKEPNQTNPDDNLGFGCKHTLLVLNNNTWILKVASVIYNYVNYMEKHRHRLYIDFIYPELYGEYYSGDMQDDELGPAPDELETDKDTIDIANKWAREKSKFKKGNKMGIRFASNGPEKKLKLDTEDEEPESLDNMDLEEPESEEN